ncbi:MAG: hypothetical protein HYU64_09285 [Armatimonadetes bacterium]|nr:hypothetical protein [Armatimonadota bacterium]
MTRRYLLPAILFISLIFSGCGGGGGSAGSQGPSGAGSPEGTLDSGGGPTGRIELAIQWPQVSKVGKLIPQAADRVEVSVSGEGLSQSLFQSVPRSQMQNNQAIVSFPSVPVGNKVVEVKALDSANNIVAHRIKPISVTSGQQSQVEAPLGMTVSTVALCLLSSPSPGVRRS